MVVVMKRAAILGALLLAASAGASPTDEPTVARARAHFEAGRALHRLGRFAEAAAEFEASYNLTPRPEMLMNIGTAHWRAGNLRQAAAAYRHFLDEAPAADPARRQAEQSLAELGFVLTVLPAPPEPAPTPPPPIKTGASETTVASSPASPCALDLAPPPPRSRRRTVLWSTGAAAVVAGVTLALGLGLGLGLQQPSYPPTAFGSVHFGR